MAQFTLTTRQRKTIGALLVETLEEQRAVKDVYTPNLANGKVREADCHDRVKSALTELGHTAGLPGTVRSLAKDLEPDGTWAGKITVT